MDEDELVEAIREAAMVLLYQQLKREPFVRLTRAAWDEWAERATAPGGIRLRYDAATGDVLLINDKGKNDA